MFQLQAKTDPSWLQKVLPHLDQLLIEQAHLEKKAASAAVTCLFRYAEHSILLAPLSKLAREELEHFELVLGVLEARGIVFTKLKPSPYPTRLLAAIRGVEPARLLDHLLCSAIIEARSCERMKILAAGLRGHDDELATMYHGLVVSEARHHHLYVELARGIFSSDEVTTRLDELLVHEAEILATATALPRLHN